MEAMQEMQKLEKTCRFLEKLLKRLEVSHRKPENIEKFLLYISSLIDKASVNSSYLSFLHANVFFRLGQISNKKAHFVTAIKKLEAIQSSQREYNFLWGKILFCLAHFSDEEKFVEAAIDKLQHCEENSEVLWCIGLAYVFMAKRSLEVIDIKKAVNIYNRVSIENLLFKYDYAESLYIFGSWMQDKMALQGALDILKKIIIDAETIKKEIFSRRHPIYGKDNLAYRRVWTLYIKVTKRILEIEERNPESLDSFFYDAICAIPEERGLWTEWSEIYIRQGWLKKDFTLIEKGLNFITCNVNKHSFTKEKPSGAWFEPIVFAEALATLGLFGEDLKLIKEAERIIFSILEIYPYNPESWHAFGLLHLAYGLYFSDRKHLLQAIHSFKRGLEIYNRSFLLWHGLFEAYFSLSILEDNVKYFQKALEINGYLLQLRPHSPLLHYEAALILLHFGGDDEDLLFAAIEEFEMVLTYDNDPKYICRYAEALDRLGQITGHILYFEKGIDMLMKLREGGANSPSMLYVLALLYAHLGQYEEDEECLYRAHYLFDSLSKKRGEDDQFFCEWGNVLLHLFHFKAEGSQQRKKLSLNAEEQLIKALEYGNIQAHYHLACLYSLTKNFELSLEQLQKAYEKGILPQFSDLEQDLWLEGIRNTLAFQKFVEVCRDRKS